jgi:phage baseplate assembly protein W
MESGIERQIETTRHALRNEVNSAFVRLENKVELISEKQATTGEAIARIETILLNGHKTQ